MTSLDRSSDGSRSLSWAAGAKSSPIRIEGGSVLSMYIPSTFTCTEATFEVLHSDGTYIPVHYKGELLSILITPGARNIMPIELFAVCDSLLKVVLDTNETGDGRFYLIK